MVAAASVGTANGSWSEEEESPKETSECDYDIDDIIRHSSQHGASANASSTTVPCSEQMMTDSPATTRSPVSMEIYWQYDNSEHQQQHHQQSHSLSMEADGDSTARGEEKKLATGGMAFVISFDQGEDGQGTGKATKPALTSGNHRRLQQQQTRQSTTPVTAEPVGGGRLARHSSWRRSRNGTTSTPTTTETVSAKETVEVNNASDHGGKVNSVGRIRDSAAEERSTKDRLASASQLASATANANASQVPLTGDATSVRSTREDTVTRSASRSSSAAGTMKKSRTASSSAAGADKDGHAKTTSVHRSTHNPRPGGGQLSESAVYLINRMFEDSDYHRYQCAKEQSADGHQQHQYGESGGGGHSYSEHEHIYASLSSSPRSASPYSTNQHQRHNHASSPHICNSSTCTASTRMEYDESLSSLHSTTNSDHHSCAQRVRSSHGLPQSLNTTIVSHQSSSPSSQQSTLQVDSAIDEDGGDLIPDDISEAGTYTIELDKEDGSKHRKKTPSEQGAEEDEPLTRETVQAGVGSLRREGHFADEDTCSTVAEQVASNTEDYEEDADCEVEDNEEEEEEEEDQLEIARRKIDELFNVYSSQKSKECAAELSGAANNSGNNSTFTRPKRRSRATVSTDEEEETAATTSATSDECLPRSIHYDSPKGRSSFSKKRISTELMSALKKINIKLERTAKLGKTMGSEGEEPKKRVIPSASSPLRHHQPQSSAVYTASKTGKTHSAPATPLLSENRKSFRYSKPAAIPTATRVSHPSRKSSAALTSASSVDDFDDQSSVLSTETYIQPVTRGRSESVNSAPSNNNNSNNNSMRFNRAFALRRARLGMDTCGVEISESAANKAKEAQAKSVPKPKPQPPAFRRNDGGRFSLRVPSATGNSRTRQLPTSQVKRLPVTTTRTSTTGTVIPKSSPTSSSATPSSVKSMTVKAAPSKPRAGSYSASASVCSSSENINFSKMSSPSPRTVRKLRSSSNAVSTAMSAGKTAHSDNEIVLNNDGESSSCGEEPQLFTRFGRSSLRSQPSTSSTPWLQSLKDASREGEFIALSCIIHFLTVIFCSQLF